MALRLFGQWDVQHPDDTHLERTGLAFWNENMAGAATVDLSGETAYWGRQSNKWERTWILRLMEPPWQPCMIEGKEISTLCKLLLPLELNLIVI